MAEQNDTGCRPFSCDAAIAQYLRVKASSTGVAVAGASDISIGTLRDASFAASDVRTVMLRSKPGTHKCVASDVIAKGDPVYAAASGKVAPSGSIYEGIALSASAANGDVIEVMMSPNTDISSAIANTTAAAFEVDSDAATPKIALSGQSGGTGDYTTTLKPETTLSGDNAIIVPEADGDTLVAVQLAQTLTNKTLTGPLFTQATETVAATNVITAAESGKVFFLSHATEFVSTLPAPAAGLRYTFIVANAPESASYTIVTNSSANVILGQVYSSDLDAAGNADFETSGCDTITFVDAKSVVGDRVEVYCDGTNWFVYCFCSVFDAITLTTAS